MGIKFSVRKQGVLDIYRLICLATEEMMKELKDENERKYLLQCSSDLSSRIMKYEKDLKQKEVWECDLCGEKEINLSGEHQELIKKGWFCTRIRSSKIPNIKTEAITEGTEFSNIVISDIHISPVFCPICKLDILKTLKLHEETGWG